MWGSVLSEWLFDSSLHHIGSAGRKGRSSKLGQIMHLTRSVTARLSSEFGVVPFFHGKCEEPILSYGAKAD